MAKRKRLDVPESPVSLDLETKSTFPRPSARMPIADVARDTAGRAALEEVAREMTAAEGEGRVVKKLPLETIQMHHLSRDRMMLDATEMDELKASIAARGQQTPIEVLALSGGQFGLISGLRRIEALRALGVEHVLALVKRPETSQDLYQAMVEENELRANLSFYERANIAVAAVGQGVYPDIRSAVAGLFAHTTPAKRSKILKFVTVREKLGKALKFPTAIPEKLGLALGHALENDSKCARRISDALRKSPSRDAASERRTLERAVQRPSAKPPAQPEKLAPGVTLQQAAGRVVLSGSAVDAEFCEALRSFAVSHAKNRG